MCLFWKEPKPMTTATKKLWNFITQFAHVAHRILTLARNKCVYGALKKFEIFPSQFSHKRKKERERAIVFTLPLTAHRFNHNPQRHEVFLVILSSYHHHRQSALPFIVCVYVLCTVCDSCLIYLLKECIRTGTTHERTSAVMNYKRYQFRLLLFEWCNRENATRAFLCRSIFFLFFKC